MLLKVKDLREMSTDDLGKELETTRKDLVSKKMAFHARQLDNSSAMRDLKKSIARIVTVIKEKQAEAAA